MRAAADVARDVAEALMLTCGRDPGGPFRHVADSGDPRPDLCLFADGHAIADRFAMAQNEIEEMIVLIDDDRARRLFARIVDEVPAELLRDWRSCIVRRI